MQIKYSVFIILIYFYIMDGVWVFNVLLLVIPLKWKDYHHPIVLHRKWVLHSEEKWEGPERDPD